MKINEKWLKEFAQKSTGDFMKLIKLVDYIDKLIVVAENFGIDPERRQIALEEFPIQLRRLRDKMFEVNKKYHDISGNFLLPVLTDASRAANYELFVAVSVALDKIENEREVATNPADPDTLA